MFNPREIRESEIICMISENPENYDTLKRLNAILQKHPRFAEIVNNGLHVKSPLEYDKSNPEPVRVLVAGSKGWYVASAFERTLDSLFKNVGDLVLVFGDTNQGFDRMAHDYAHDRGLPYEKVSLNYSEKKDIEVPEPYANNAYQLAHVSHLVAFWDGYDSEVELLIEAARALDKTIKVFLVDGNRHQRNE